MADLDLHPATNSSNDDNTDNDSMSQTSNPKLKIDDNDEPPAPPAVNGHADDESDIELDAEAAGEPATRREVKRLENKVNYMTHQVYRIMLALNVPPCPCGNCESTHEHQNRLILKTTESNKNNNATNDSTTSPSKFASQLMNNMSAIKNMGNPASMLSQGALEHDHHMSDQAAPKSARWATPEQRLAIANFAAAYGASAASRKFGIPTAAASYCHRKVFQRPLPKGRRPMADMAEAEKFMPAEGSSGSPMNSGRSPSLTGPGGAKIRGRPRLIGDELDAELMDHLRSLRKQNNWPRYSAHQILNIATDFIRSRAPGLLAEDGGQIVLKITWANTVMQRLNALEHSDRYGSTTLSNVQGLVSSPNTPSTQQMTSVSTVLLNAPNSSRGDYADPGAFNEGEEDDNNDDDEMDDFDDEDAFESKPAVSTGQVNFSQPNAVVH